MRSNLIVLADVRAERSGDDSLPAPTSTGGRRSRFPVADDLGIYCWFCAEMLDVKRAQRTDHPRGEGHYHVTCPDCRRSTFFDRSDELEDGD